MSDIGLHRIKRSNLTKGTYTVKFFQDAIEVASKTLEIRDICTNDILVKYMDRNGIFRFYSFNKFWLGNDSPELIGKVNNIVTSILTSSGSEKNIGYKNKRTMQLTADDVTESDLNNLVYLYMSPKVYIYFNSKWIEVTVNNADTTYRRRRNISEPFRITVELPEYFNITLL